MKKILLIEANKAFAKLIATKLRVETGYDVIPAGTLAEARVLAGTQRFELAVTGLDLPDGAGAEAVDFLLAQKIPPLALVEEYDERVKRLLEGKLIVDVLLKRTTEDLNILGSTVKRVLANRRVKALVVDDAMTYRVMMKDLLESQFFRVFEASDGVEALKMLEEHPDIKLVITDYYMPNMDGFELVTRIRKKHKKERLSIIVLSGAQAEDVAAKFLKFGANDYIKKPFSDEEFNVRVNLNAENMDLIESIHRMANSDFMTGLYNRRYFFETGNKEHQKAAREGTKLCVAMLDIDHFKRVNDTYGHDAGDEAIKKFARILQDMLPETCLIARFGGEEFCVLMPAADASKAKGLLETVRKAVEAQSMVYGELEFGFTVSAGVCSKQLPHLEEMVNQADAMLYEAKHGGRNRIRVA
ncbi:MAG: diguanylate cyclase [Nitrospinae bacterium]|nr:diguanylate cyclase [Nitrospinota bacterium]